MSESLDIELELLASSLLPSEALEGAETPGWESESPQTSSAWPREFAIANADSGRRLVACVREGYPALSAVDVQLKGGDLGRDAAHRSEERIQNLLREHWTEDDDSNSETTAAAENAARNNEAGHADEPHHALLTSHHLLSKTKRKDFIALSSQLSLTGFSKVGHPGIYYAMGTESNLKEWLKEVKSWNWLNLRVRVGIEPIPLEYEERSTVQDESRGKEEGARGGLGRGNWVELEKISDALTWMRDRGREEMLTEIGIGA
ncbi:hypothetical protein A1Q2_07936 [Trichosporon asahii var. asahii CBS 8904]|uniref:Uncharacterized protein n=1 Tax=Trichosporon asahii var. asahii (strain CBS 8904) TaxID=1220162 RepID=K1VLZ4_TRIAC|nr:hypothetical protein A1Q2_07936 [Trichosporon asahii var. asahii CBS 8904]